MADPIVTVVPELTQYEDAGSPLAYTFVSDLLLVYASGKMVRRVITGDTYEDMEIMEEGDDE